MHKPFCVLRTATYISKSVLDDRSASRYWFNSFTCKKILSWIKSASAVPYDRAQMSLKYTWLNNTHHCTE